VADACGPVDPLQIGAGGECGSEGLWVDDFAAIADAACPVKTIAIQGDQVQIGSCPPLRAKVKEKRKKGVLRNVRIKTRMSPKNFCPSAFPDGKVKLKARIDASDGCTMRGRLKLKLGRSRGSIPFEGALPNVCGDGIVAAALGEECDDGNAEATDDCNGCKPTYCGDCNVNGLTRSEACDDGNDVAGDGCFECKAEGCGNGISGQVICGNPSDPATCRTEECDDGNEQNFDTCDGNCTLPACGNGEVGLDENGEVEECDDGALNSATVGDRCRPDCVAPACGDGVIDAQSNREVGDDGVDEALCCLQPATVSQHLARIESFPTCSDPACHAASGNGILLDDRLPTKYALPELVMRCH